MKCHVIIAVTYLIFIGFIASYFDQPNSGLLLFLIPTLIHFSLALGSYKKSEFSRKLSVFMFILIGIGTAPIGTILAIFWLLPCTTWVTPESHSP